MYANFTSVSKPNLSLLNKNIDYVYFMESLLPSHWTQRTLSKGTLENRFFIKIIIITLPFFISFKLSYNNTITYACLIFYMQSAI